MAILASDIIVEIRRKLDQRPLENEDVQTDSAVIGSPSTNFGDLNLLTRINHAVVFIAKQVKAMHISASISNYTGPFPDVAANADLLRPLFSRVFANTVRATQRSVDRQRRLENSGRAASATFPVYTYEDGKLEITPSSGSDNAFIVIVPTILTATNQTLGIDERFEAAVIWHVVASCYETMRQGDMHSAFMVLFQDEIQPYLLDNRYDNIFDERENDTS